MEKTSRALIADDDEFLRQSLNAILRKHFNFREIAECASFDDAVEQLNAMASVELALFDLRMPGMENPGNLKAVRECFPETTVVVVSASEEREHILQALEAGAHGYIVKRVGVSKLIEALGIVRKGHIVAPWSLSVGGTNEARVAPARDRQSPEEPPALTPRQRDVLSLVVAGKSNKDIARTLNLGEGTVKVHMAALFRTLGVNSRAGAAALGARHML